MSAHTDSVSCVKLLIKTINVSFCGILILTATLQGSVNISILLMRNSGLREASPPVWGCIVGQCRALVKLAPSGCPVLFRLLHALPFPWPGRCLYYATGPECIVGVSVALCCQVVQRMVLGDALILSQPGARMWDMAVTRMYVHHPAADQVSLGSPRGLSSSPFPSPPLMSAPKQCAR